MMGRLVFLSCATLGFILFMTPSISVDAYDLDAFASANGTQFMVNGKTFYFNGFNAYWFMVSTIDPVGRTKVTSALKDASSHGMTVARTWAFSDGGYTPLQISPGRYNETVFEGLDFVISEARSNGVYLILSLVNNYPDFGGRKQYVQWAREQGENVTSDDDFYKNGVVKGYYKNHIQTVLSRRNTVTGVVYKDDPTILAWELINEPRCESDLSGSTLQAWITEMAGYVKSLDTNHMVEIGLEGFYGESERRNINPNGYIFGSDFISNNQVPGIDFATIHAYPDQWLAQSDFGAQLDFLELWMQAHVNDSAAVLKKPLVFGEFGKSSKTAGYSITQRDTVFSAAYSAIYSSASSGGPMVGGVFWQLLSQGMDNMRDGYEVVFAESPSTAEIIASQSQKMASLNHQMQS